MSSLLVLQEYINKNPRTYKDDFVRQIRHLENSIEIFKLKPSDESKDFVSLLQFVSKCAQKFKNETSKLPHKLIELLEQHQQVLHPVVRRQVVLSLISLRNSDVVDSKTVLPVLFKIFRIHDKSLRKIVYLHIVADITRLNQKTKNSAINRSLQNFMFSMLKDSFRIAAKTSLDVMIQLYRKRIWNDERTVNVIATACFSDDTKILVAGCSFFLGTYELDEEEEQAKKKEEVHDKEKDLNEIRIKKAFSRSKKTKSKDSRFKRQVKSIEKRIEKEMNKDNQSVGALHMLHDPQGFVEKLFQKLKSSNESFQVRLIMMDVVSRCISANKLTLLGFYAFLQKYLAAHQASITKVLAICAQSVHENVPPEVLHPIVMTLANNFASDRSAPEAMTVGLNTIREICSRQPLVMRKSLLRDLTQYSRSKDKNVFHAARGIITLFRDLAPKMLNRKDRGRDAPLDKSIATFGGDTAGEGLQGIDLLEDFREKVGEITDKTRIIDGDGKANDSDEDWQDDSDDEEDEGLGAQEFRELADRMNLEGDDDDDDENDDDDDEQNEQSEDDNEDQVMDLDSLQNMFEAGQFDDAEDDSGSDKEESEDEAGLFKEEESEDEYDQVKAEELRKKAEEKAKRIADLSSTKILSQREFELMNQLKLRAKVHPRKRKETVDPASLEVQKKSNKRKRGSDDEGGEEEEEKGWKHANRKKGGQTQVEKKKNKPFQMIQQSRGVRSKATMGQTQKRLAKAKARKKETKHSLKGF
ncbi:hypothetical protein AKO1_010996 [Acrasis kona]|uniref:Protein SDA1 n=1 Tax=Acrasis kona TaxID=1008807 RepID=A0AAW2YTU5_9EUKA